MTEEDHYATELIREWLADDAYMYNKCVYEARSHTNVSFLGHMIKRFVYDICPELPHPFSAILYGELSMVDWIDIAAGYMPDGNDKHGGTTE